MNSSGRQRKAEQKRNYERIRDIKRRLKVGETTTFQERQVVKIYDDRVNKSKNSI